MNKQFKDKGYCVVKGAISPELRDFVTQYALFDEMQNQTEGDAQVPNAYSKYADPAMETMLIHLHSLMEKTTGLTLHPTYSYYRIYAPGDILERHKDRESCEISCTLCFNYEYTDYEWPIYMDGTPVVLEPGDMVVYRGCDLDHWREPFDIKDLDAWQVQGFFHYVDANGPNADFKYDRRESIGYKEKKTSTVKPNTPSYIEYTR